MTISARHLAERDEEIRRLKVLLSEIHYLALHAGDLGQIADLAARGPSI